MRVIVIYVKGWPIEEAIVIEGVKSCQKIGTRSRIYELDTGGSIEVYEDAAIAIKDEQLETEGESNE